MFKWLKNKEDMNKDFRGMKREMFKNSNVEYIPANEENRSKQLKDITNYASYYGLKLKFRLGVFTSVKGDEIIAEPVFRVEKVGESTPKKNWGKTYIPTGRPVGRPRKDKSPKEIKHVGEKYKKICDYLNKGLSVKEIVKKVDTSPQYVYGIKKGLKS